ncbi:Retrovirus-related Pol polyprotein from transposon TNT 1-94 [Vitis vinifera]|uniref:Retrovirus-related Pol polyprotein from transposon TNT 1-94 n=1 Tax=Vitis vinifera TaxID=29760 RepID=A0A438CNM6_VITVI|nr:Retrovirus-related Pol polyprotein from transposon TNT 1-94 [Vitis vinifera]
MEDLEKSETWALIPLPKENKTVGCRWVFSIKHKADGSIECTRQANLNWPLHQFDVKNAFFHGDLKEEVYMDIPPGYMTSSKTEVVYDMIITGDDTEEISRLQGQLATEFEMKNLGRLKYFLGIEVTRSKQDADWAGNISDRKSTSGYFTFVGGNLVTWRSKKQKVVALSSAKASSKNGQGICELIWLKRLLSEIGFAPSSEMDLFCDNKAAIDIAHNLVQHDHTKHVEVDRNFIKQNLEEKVFTNKYKSDGSIDLCKARLMAKDDMIPIGDDVAEMEALKKILAKESQISLILEVFFGNEVARNNNGILMSQKKYALDLLKETRMLGCKPCETPMDSNQKLGVIDKGDPIDKGSFQRLSKKKNVVARSSIEAKFRTVSHGMCEILWIKRVLKELKIAMMYYDNKTMVSILHNLVHHDRTKHVEVDHHFIKEKIEQGEICMTYVQPKAK